MPVRIVFVTNNYTPYSGGVVSSINATVDALIKKNHDVTIITLDFLGKKHITDPAYVIRLACPIKFMYKQNHMAVPWKPQKLMFQLFNHIRPDIIHIHHPFLLGKAALKAARKLNIRCVFTYHTLYEEYAHYIPIPQYISKPLIGLLVKKFCTNVDGIITPSMTIKNYLTKKNITCPIITIASSLRDLFFTSQKTPSLNNKPSFNLLLVSRFTKEKNIPLALEVIKRLPNNFTLTLVGYGTEYMNIQKIAHEDLNLSQDRVKFVHKPAQDTLLSLYQSAHLFIFPSQTDTQGIVLAEAMSQGIPVIALDGPGQRDIIQNGYNGFIVDNIEQMITTIKWLSHSKKQLDTLAHGALETAKKYHPETIINHLTTFYRAIIQQP